MHALTYICNDTYVHTKDVCFTSYCVGLTDSPSSMYRSPEALPSPSRATNSLLLVRRDSTVVRPAPLPGIMLPPLT